MSHLDPLTQPDPKLGVFPPVSVPAIHSGLLSSDNVNSNITLVYQRMWNTHYINLKCKRNQWTGIVCRFFF